MKKTILFLIAATLFLLSCSQSIDNDVFKFENETLELTTFIKDTLHFNNRKIEFLEPESEKHTKLKAFLFENTDNWKKANMYKFPKPNHSVSSNHFHLNIYDDFVTLMPDSKYKFKKNISKGELDFLKKEGLFIHKCGDYLGQGIIIEDSYTFCSIMAIDIDYEYKYGNWTFWTKDKKLVAKGIFAIETYYQITNCGGADIEFSKIHEKDWIFYDEQGNITTPTKELIHELEKG